MSAFNRILLVDDSSRDRELALNALASHHLINEVIELRDGAEALDYLHRRGPFSDRPGGNPAVVLLDLKMPKVDGLEVLRQIRRTASLRLIPVVVMTSSREEQDLCETYSNGVNAYVVKPVNFPQFVEAVQHVGQFWAVLNEPPPGQRSERVDDAV